MRAETFPDLMTNERNIRLAETLRNGLVWQSSIFFNQRTALAFFFFFLTYTIAECQQDGLNMKTTRNWILFFKLEKGQC